MDRPETPLQGRKGAPTYARIISGLISRQRLVIGEAGMIDVFLLDKRRALTVYARC
jgi:hypothetical protein